ncbi:Enolase-phosphatase E1 [Pirellulimonas nuda]|uniref:Enolase-phosphatase E1 n=1 Tax=Pirellulimonas nuda TaxID=2528009 RepID=A0A518D9P1_9BACT|nr:acireductone synthase [Pirellulimonas nuda]QDU88201.1 Enolase-phosphatase E1 [Pirellulimonas nuda]
MHLVQGVLLDVEGTTSAVAYVYDVMFPYARQGMQGYLDTNWGSESLAEAAEQVARDAGHASLDAWRHASGSDPQRLVLDEAIRLMDADVKATGLKQLQGLVWQSGFESGELRAHVFPDVPPALAAWRAAGVDVRVYSSGSIHAQRLFFGHSEAGDLLPQLSGHYDTTTGPKREAASYAQIAADWGLPAAGVLFLSDIVAELDAASTAGMQTALVVRPGNAAVEPGHGHPVVETFAALPLTGVGR